MTTFIKFLNCNATQNTNYDKRFVNYPVDNFLRTKSKITVLIIRNKKSLIFTLTHHTIISLEIRYISCCVNYSKQMFLIINNENTRLHLSYFCPYSTIKVLLLAKKIVMTCG